MSLRPRDFTRLNRLKSLADDPAAQSRHALDLLARERSLPVVEAALAVLVERAEPAARPVLLDRFAHYGGPGLKQDLGGHLRTAILKALRPIARPADMPLLERSAFTYEFTYYGEAASGIRSAAIVTLNELDPERASYHAARLLGDQHTHRMSGEPAVSAVRLLAAGHHLLPLYAYAMADPPELPEGMPDPRVPEVVAECLRHLTGVPEALLDPVLERHGTTEDDIVLLGLLDLLLGHPTTARFTPHLLTYLRAPRRYDVFRYLVTIIIARRRDDLLAGLADLMGAEPDPRKRQLFRDAVALRPGDPALDGLLAAVLGG